MHTLSGFHAQNKVGGGEGLVGIYGSMTQQGTSAIMTAMVQHTGMGPGSTLVDLGAGLCRSVSRFADLPTQIFSCSILTYFILRIVLLCFVDHCVRPTSGSSAL